MIDYHNYKGLFTQTERRLVWEKDERERQKVKFSFLDTPCVSAALLQCMGVSSQKDYMQHRVEWSQSRLSHQDIMRKTLSLRKIIPWIGESIQEGKLLNGNIRIVPRAKDWDNPSELYFHCNKAMVFLGQCKRHHQAPNFVSAPGGKKPFATLLYFISNCLFTFGGHHCQHQGKV